MQNLASGTLGRYRMTQLLRDGEGRQVYAALDVSDSSQRTVVKVAALASASDAARLKREYEILLEACGPGVVVALEYGVSPSHGVAYLVLADQGPSLAAVLAAAPNCRFPIEMALAATHAMAVALKRLHERGWNHCDLKPGNVLCKANGDVVLSDLEFATQVAASNGEKEKLPESLVVGTPPFVAPELWRDGAAALSPAADVWALGVTLYLALFAEYPFGDSGPEEIIAAIHRGPPPHLEKLKRPLAILLSSFFTIDPAARPGRGDAAVRAIEHTAELLGVNQLQARAAFARQVAAVPDRFPPPEPGTQVAAAPPPDTTTPTPRPAAPASRPPAPYVPMRRPEGVGAADAGPRRMRTSWMEEFLDVSSKADIPRPQPAPSAAPRPATPAPAPQAALMRRAAARWYRRMNPQRNFPLSVVFSGKQIRLVGGSGLGITLGQREIVLDADHPVLAVEPRFPGCLISPPRADVVVSQETTVCRFWITPLVCGELPEACITIRYRDKVVETLATPARVVTRTAAKVLAVFGLAFPVVSKGLNLAGWDPDNLLRRSVPYVADLVSSMGLMRTGLLLTAILLAGAAGYFYITRPLLSEEAEPALLPQAS